MILNSTLLIDVHFGSLAVNDWVESGEETAGGQSRAPVISQKPHYMEELHVSRSLGTSNICLFTRENQRQVSNRLLMFCLAPIRLTKAELLASFSS